MKYFLTYTSMGKCKIDYEKYRKRFEELYPEMTEKERVEIFEMRVIFWEWLVKNQDLFLNV